MALAKSEKDKTPSAGHFVLAKDSADTTQKDVNDRKISLKRLKGDREVIELSVPSPENPAKRRKVAIEVATVDQVLSTTDEKVFEKGTNDFTTEYLTGLQYFSNDDISRNVDWTVIQGGFTKEDKELPCKMLVTRPTGMLYQM